MDDLSDTIELYRTLVRLGRLDDALQVLVNRILTALTRLGGYRYLAELARIVIEDPGWPQKIDHEDEPVYAAAVFVLMGLCYQLAGDPVRALDSCDLFTAGQTHKYFDVYKLVLQSMALEQRGCLAEAERCAHASLAQPDLDKGIASEAMTALGSVLLHRGLPEEGAVWLGDYRVESDDETFGRSLYELGWAAVLSPLG